MSPEELEPYPVSKFIEIAEHIVELLGFYSDHGDPDSDDSPVKQARECREEAMKLAWKLEALVSQSVEFALEMDLNADAVNQHLGNYSSMIRHFGDWRSVEERDEWGGYANRIVWQGPTFDELREGCIALKREPLFLTLLKHESEHRDGQFGPDGFYLDGVLATGLTDNELALLKLALDKQPDGPTEDDVCNLTEFKSWTRQRLDKLLGTIKAKFLTAKCPRVLRWANRHLVFREPRQRAKAAPKSVSKANGRKAGRKRGETLQKDGRHKRH